MWHDGGNMYIFFENEEAILTPGFESSTSRVGVCRSPAL
jgi:hypothetical protein